jgi:imidazolonepropionase-like amidohydrolase
MNRRKNFWPQMNANTGKYSCIFAFICVYSRLFFMFAQAPAQTTFLIRGADVYPGNGPMIPGASILVENGRISEVGTNVRAPRGVRVIEARGKRVYPGLIDSGTALGLAEVQQERMTVDTGELGVYMPQLRALTSVNPASEHFPVARANGIAAAVSFPSSGGGGGGSERQVIAGQAALIRTDGWTWEDMSIRGAAAMQLIFPVLTVVPSDAPPPPQPNPNAPARTYTDGKRNYDKQIEELNEFFENARRYQAAKNAGAADFKLDLKFEAMLPVLDRQMPVAINAARERAIRDAIAFAKKQNIRIVIVGPRELGAAAAELKANNIPVVFGRTLSLPLNEDSPYDSAFALPAEAYKAGVKFAFGTFDNQFVRDLPYDAAAAVAFGLPYEEALKAITINAAEIWGVAGETGSIEKGKSADLIIASGDILETPTRIEHLYLQGRDIDLSNRQTRLYERYLNRP